MDIKKLAEEVRELVQNNCHTEAYYLIAKELDVKWLEILFARIQAIIERHGELPMVLYEERRKAYNDLMEHAKANLSQADYQLLYQAT